MCSQRPSSSCASKVRAPGCGVPRSTSLVRTIGLLPGRDDALVGRARRHRLVGQVVQLWKLELHSTSRLSASHSTKASGDRLDRVAQAQVGGRGLLHQASSAR